MRPTGRPARRAPMRAAACNESQEQQSLRQPRPAAEERDRPEREEEGPLRRCALTRARRPKEELIRFVLGPDGCIVPDIRERLPGRGVWVTAAREKIADAVRRKVFAAALKTAVKAPDELAAQVDRLLTEAALKAFSLANKAGEAVFGFAKVEEAIGRGQVQVLVHASDASEDGCRKLNGRLLAKNQEKPVAAVRIFTGDELSLASGRTNVIHAAMLHGGAAASFLREASRVERYRGGAPALASPNGADTDKE